MLARALGRLILVPVGFVLGLLAALTVLFTLGLEKVTHAVHGREIDAQAVETLWSALLGAKALASVATLVPALLVVIVGEVARVRSALYYMAGGGIAMAVMPFFARSASLDGGLAQLGLIWQVFATAGFVGGAVYWLVAGRWA